MKVLFLVVAFSFLLLSYKITQVPPGINGDEVVIAYQSSLIANTGHDESGRFLPLFTQVPGSLDWKQPLYFYPVAILFKLFGVSYEILRFTSILFTLISLVLLFYLANKLFGLIGAVVASFLFITTPLVMIQSHLALENVAVMPIILIWSIMLYKYTSQKRSKYLLYAGVTAGVGLFAYNGMRLLVPMICLLTLIYIFRQNLKNYKRFKEDSIQFIIGITPFIVILLLSRGEYAGAAFNSARPSPLGTYQEVVGRYLSNFDLTFLFLKGDIAVYHSTGNVGMFLIASLPLFIIGAFYAVKNKLNLLTLLLAVFFFIPTLYIFVPAVYRASRLMIIIPPFVILGTYGFMKLMDLINKKLRTITFIVLILGITLQFNDFLNDYWLKYPERIKNDFSTPLHQAFDIARSESLKYNYNVMVERGIMNKEYYSFKFFKEAYFPKSEIIAWDYKVMVPERTILIANPDIIDRRLREELKTISPKIDYYQVFLRQ